MNASYLDEKKAAAYLTALGIPFSPRTLRTQRITGGGIPFVKVGGRVFYRQAEIDAYLGALPVLTSTSDTK